MYSIDKIKAFCGFVLMTIVFMVASPLPVSAQSLSISGQVLDNTGTPLAGAYVMVDGTSAGTLRILTDIFSITADEGSLLRFSFIGFLDHEQKVDGKKDCPAHSAAT